MWFRPLGWGSPEPQPALLQVRALVAEFDGFRAIDGLDLDVKEGELRFLIGPNGAGKSTLVDVITGLTRPRSGTVHFAGHDLRWPGAHGRVRRSHAASG